MNKSKCNDLNHIVVFFKDHQITPIVDTVKRKVTTEKTINNALNNAM